MRFLVFLLFQVLNLMKTGWALIIVQYNVEWLFLDYNTHSDCPGQGCSWKNETDAKRHLQTVSDTLRNLGPDIMNLCEVEGITELTAVSENLGPPFTPYFIKGTDTGTGQNVGLISRIVPIRQPYRMETRYEYPINGSRCGYKGKPADTGVSKHAITEFSWNLENQVLKVAVISAHLLAFPTDVQRCAEREAQAMVLQGVIRDYLIREYEVLFLGDLNDFDGENLDANRNVPLSNVLEILKTDGQLKSVAEKIAQSERYTDWYDKNGDGKSSPNEFSMIDHILVTANLEKHIQDAYIYHGYTEEVNTYQSDHFPVVVVIG
jgi:endonuclease/exonuclease/phosphatase family metal-dependent hydrolase